MVYQTLATQLKSSRDQREKFKQLRVIVKPESNVKKAKKICKSIAPDILSSLQRNRVKPALTAVRTLILLVGPDETINQIKRSGILRASKYDFNVRSVSAFLQELSQHAVLYDFQSNHLAFFKSATSLYDLATPLAAIYNSIIQRLVKNQRHVVKTLLAEVDSHFLFGATSRSQALGLSPGWSSEEVTEAYSYLLAVFKSVIGLKEVHVIHSDPVAGYTDVYPVLLNDAATICQYKECEILIESFPYEARTENGEVIVEATNISVEKCMRIGYIQAEMQLNIRREGLSNARASKSGAASIQSLAGTFFADVGEKLVRLVKTPIRRYVLTFPLYEDVAEIFRDDRVFAEDLSMLEMLGNEDYITASEVMHLPVVEDITVIDILKVQRLIRFVQIGMMNAIDNHPTVAEQAGVQMTSCVPIYNVEQLLANFELAVGKEKAGKMLKIMSCDFTKEFIDLQYTPLIVVGDICMFSMAVFTSSNLVRNLLVHHKKRLTLRDSSDKDPMQETLMHALLNAGFLVQPEFDPGTLADPREIDLIAYKDGHLFLFECKNSFHPCNVYERRTTFEYIQYATGQLDLRIAWLSDEVKQRKAFKQLNWDLPTTTNIHTCIAFGNRVYNGLVLDGHPVRSVHELLNVLSRGSISLIGDEIFSIWAGEQFSVADLIKQLGPSSTILDFSDAMFNAHRKVWVGSSSLNLNTLNLDFVKLSENVRGRYRPLGNARQ